MFIGAGKRKRTRARGVYQMEVRVFDIILLLGYHELLLE
jgi:hypothetical protein